MIFFLYAVNMPINKTWMQLWYRRHSDYEKGVNEFLDFAFSRSCVEQYIRCPCLKCNSVFLTRRLEVRADFFKNKMVRGYR